MEKSNYFYKDRCLFGAYPTQKDIEDLENYNVRLFVNLTTEEENLYEYKTKYDIIKFPINDLYFCMLSSPSIRGLTGLFTLNDN